MMKNDNLEHIKCPRCGWHSAVKDKKTGLITCQYCMYRTKRRKNEQRIAHLEVMTLKLPPELKAKNHTFKLYDWEVEKVKEYIKYLRPRKEDEKQRMEILKK